MQRRTFLALIILAAHRPALAKRAGRSKRQVLFVCTGNFYRSRFAEALFNETPPGLWRAFSRGFDASTPRETHVSPLVLKELERRHIPLERADGKPTRITQADLDRADLVVLLDREEHEPMLRRMFPELRLDKVRFWSVKDTPGMTPDQAFAAIDREIEALSEELSVRSDRPRKAPRPRPAPPATVESDR
jgi:protein-tyrosine phosphatase